MNREFASVAEVLKPQDILVCLYCGICVTPETYAQIAEALHIGIGTAHAAAQRARHARLLDASNQPIRANLLEFLIHGVRYVFYPERGGMIRGMPTGAGAPMARERLASTAENSPVWPTSKGRVRGYALTPLYPTVPEAAISNPTLHAALAAVDLLRIGSARERLIAGQLLEKLMNRDDPRDHTD